MYVYTGFGGIIGGSCIFFRDSNSNSANYQTLLPWRPSLWIKYASQTSLRTPLCLVWSHHSSSKASLPAEPCLALFPFHSCLQNAGWEKETGSQGVDMRLFYLLLSPLVIRDSLYSVLVFSHSLVSYVFGKHLLQALCLQQSEILVLLVDLSIDSRTQRLFFFFFLRAHYSQQSISLICFIDIGASSIGFESRNCLEESDLSSSCMASAQMINGAN